MSSVKMKCVCWYWWNWWPPSVHNTIFYIHLSIHFVLAWKNTSLIKIKINCNYWLARRFIIIKLVYAKNAWLIVYHQNDNCMQMKTIGPDIIEYALFSLLKACYCYHKHINLFVSVVYQGWQKDGRLVSDVFNRFGKKKCWTVELCHFDIHYIVLDTNSCVEAIYKTHTTLYFL